MFQAGQCRYKPSNRGATDVGAYAIQKSESALMSAVGGWGPVSVAIDASHQSFQVNNISHIGSS